MSGFGIKKDLEVKPTIQATSTQAMSGTQAGSVDNAPSIGDELSGKNSSWRNVNSSQLDSEDKLVMDFAKIAFSNTPDKMTKLLEEFFKGNPEYENSANKSQFIKQKAAEFQKILEGKGFDVSKFPGESQAVFMALLLVIIKADNDVSLKNIQSMNKDELIDKMFDKVLGYYDKISTNLPDFGSKSDLAELYKLGHMYATLTDPEYAKMPDGPKKMEACQKKITELMQILTNKEDLTFEKIAKSQAGTIGRNPIKFLKQYRASGLSFSRLLSMDIEEKFELQVEFARQQISLIGNKQLREQRTKDCNFAETFGKIYIELTNPNGSYNIAKPTHQDIYDYIMKIPEKDRTEAQQEILLYYEIALEGNKDFLKNPADITATNEMIEILRYGEIEDYLKNELNGIENINTPGGKEQAKNIIANCAKSLIRMHGIDNDQIQKLENKAKTLLAKKGLSEQDCNEIIGIYDKIVNSKDGKHSRFAINTAAASIDAASGKRTAATEKCVIAAAEAALGDKKLEGIFSKHDRDVENNTIFGRVIAHKGTQEDIDAFTGGVNTYLNPEASSQVHRGVVSDSTLSDDRKRSYAHSAIVTTDDIERKMLNAQELASVGNSAVTQGLMDAAESISDPQVRAQYITNVETYSAQAPQVSSIVLPDLSFSESAAKIAENFEKQGLKPASCSSTEILNAYSSYIDSTTKELENKKAKAMDNADKTTKKIKADQAARDEKIEKSKKVTSGSSLKEILANPNENERRDFLINYIIFGNADAIRELLNAYPNDYEILALIALYNCLPQEQAAQLLRIGKLSPSVLSDIYSFASSYKTDKIILKGLYAYTKDIRILAYNLDLLKEYVSKGLVSEDEIKRYPGLYERYKTSLTEFAQAQLDQKEEEASGKAKANNFNDASSQRIAAEKEHEQETKAFQKRLAKQGATGTGALTTNVDEEQKAPTDILTNQTGWFGDQTAYKRRKRREDLA